MLVAYFTGMRAANSRGLNNFKSSMEVKNNKDYKSAVVGGALGFSIIAFLILVSVFPAIVIALNCNRTFLSKFFVVIFAFFFSDLYMCWYVFKRYLVRDPNYCLLY